MTQIEEGLKEPKIINRLVVTKEMIEDKILDLIKAILKIVKIIEDKELLIKITQITNPQDQFKIK